MNQQQTNAIRQGAVILAEQLFEIVTNVTCDKIEATGIQKPTNHLISPDCSDATRERIRTESAEQTAAYLDANAEFKRQTALALMQLAEGYSHAIAPSIRAMFTNQPEATRRVDERSVWQRRED